MTQESAAPVLGPRPYCRRCPSLAHFVGALSTDQGKTIEWIMLCAAHSDAWTGDDWAAPVYRLGEQVTS